MLGAPHKINSIYALILVLIGLGTYLAAYLATGEVNSPTALIPALLGVVFYPMTTQMKRGNAFINHLALALTFMVGALMLFMYLRIDTTGDPGMVVRKRWSMGLVMLASFITTGFYIAGFLRRKKEGQQEGK